MKTYIHYGHREFEPELFRDIRNRQSMSKPSGGLWASDINATYGWKDWCNAENFRACDDKNAFCFVLNENAKILTIKSVKDLEKLPKVENEFSKFSSWVCLEFEKLAKKYDAIEVIKNEDEGVYWNRVINGEWEYYDQHVIAWKYMEIPETYRSKI